ncbi:hypothetical protein EKO23_10200 [Nocardioides guangzhouensis]|uniref:RNA polymerase sigma-70 region 4 domain-containing protein n=1 Tax=Nocardioides guangzhouensis TaxID=2497878 RepID=A0A4V1XZC9_9ACTN|nr:sigma factor-like helix-turn-helix DNA-binding protein [Nocardioides guangzhouensis]RYP86309.1 hypothetical protein EKO23_10200 [Nocardioides guangzhouensis]
MEGDAAFADFVSACWPRLHRVAYLLTADGVAADDALRAAFETTHARWSRVRDSDDPEADVLAALVAACVPTERRFRPRARLGELAARGRRVPGRDQDPLSGDLPGSPPPVDTGVVDRTLLWPLLCALPPRERAVLVLLHHQDLTAEEVGELLGCSAARVRAEAHDALVAVRRGLDAARNDGLAGSVPDLPDGPSAGAGPTLWPGHGAPPGEVLER